MTSYTIEFSANVPTVRFQYNGRSVSQRVAKLLANGDTNTKLAKNAGDGEWITRGLSLSPHRSAGVGNVCTAASAGCVGACLNHQGLASVFESIARARLARTYLWYGAREWFISQLQRELHNACRLAARKTARLAVRLNVFSDLSWERHIADTMTSMPEVEFYDYTKHKRRAGALLPNYWVTFSRSESNWSDCVEVLNRGCNVTAVFANPLPTLWDGFPVVDGDKTDLRFTDPRGGHIIGLKLKAHSLAERRAAIESGFAIAN